MNDIYYKKNDLYFSKLKISELGNKYKTPFFIYSEDVLCSNYLHFFQEAQKAQLRDPLICFALKSNANK